MKLEIKNYVAGQWIDGMGAIENLNPSETSDLVCMIPQGSAKDVERAIEAAKKGQLEWAKSSLEQRYDVLMNIGQELIRRKEELGHLLSREEGKPLAEGIGEIHRSGQFFTYFAAEVLRQMGETAASVRPGVDIQTTREPLGVIGIITPWNFPMAIPAWKIAPALAYGNSVILKPANQTPASAHALAEIIHRQNLPAGTFNLVMGAGREVGEALIHAEGVDGITFTGSVEVGRQIATACASRMIRCQMEMGGKNPLLVMDDADIDVAVQCAVAGGYSGTGQKCTASSRLVVMRSVMDQFVQKLTAKLEEVKVGHALEEGTSMGPVIDQKSRDFILQHIEGAVSEGAVKVTGGEALELDHKGHYISPCLLVNTTNQMAINREEIFGPVATVIPVDSYEEGMKVVNDTSFGLTAGIVTNSLHYSTRFNKEAKAGCTMVNLPTAGTDYHVPFGGRKSSSLGAREMGSYAKEFYTIVKTSYLKA